MTGTSDWRRPIAPHGGVAVALTLGVFDGLHLGHQALIDATVEEARQRQGIAAVFTFLKHPLAYLAPERLPQRLTSAARRRDLLKQHGIDQIVEITFDETIAQTEPEDFIYILRKQLGVSVLVCGLDHRFGKGGRGDIVLVGRMAPELDLKVRLVDPVKLENDIVSSTRIRQAIVVGDVAWAARALSRPHRVEGVVHRGDRRGNQIGFPTANIRPDLELLLPGLGVYAGRCDLGGGTIVPAMINIGHRPTVTDSDQVAVEAHLIDWSGDLYGHTIAIDFITRLRPERKFPSLDALKAQLAIDRDETRAVLAAQQ